MQATIVEEMKVEADAVESTDREIVVTREGETRDVVNEKFEDREVVKSVIEVKGKGKK